MPTKGTDYELFIKQVYECLNRADGLTDVDIQHDVKIVGAAGVEHQIDVFWTFKRGGVDYKVAIECKDYQSHVSKDKIATFHSILHDIGNIHGIFASRMGYQKGAIEYADKYGIQLIEIRHPVEKDWEGRMKNLQVDISMYFIGNVVPQIIVDKDAVKKHGIVLPEEQRFHASEDQTIIDFSAMYVDNEIVSENKSLSMLDLIRKVPAREVGKEKVFLYTFSNAMLEVKGLKLPIKAIKIKYDVNESKDKIHIYGDDVIKAIVKNITDGTEMIVDKFGRVNLGESL